MFKFFRTIRKKLLLNNSITQYSFYAIGEILLVVIGILIALNINNRNELKKNKITTVSSLKEIQANLLEDINASHRVLENYLLSDSIRNKIFDFENPLTHKDYSEGKVKRLGNFNSPFLINQNGYQNLIRQIDKMPEKYKSILPHLKRLYVEYNEAIDVNNKRIQSTVYNDLDYHYAQGWAVDRLKNGDMSNEEIDYYVSSKTYKNYIIKYMNDRQNVFHISQRYRVKAIASYLKIDSLLGINKRTVLLKDLGFVDKNSIQKYLGTYQDTSLEYMAELYHKNNYLFTKFEDSIETKNWKIDENLFMYLFDNKHPVVWKFSENKNNRINMEFVNNGFKLEKETN